MSSCASSFRVWPRHPRRRNRLARGTSDSVSDAAVGVGGEVLEDQGRGVEPNCVLRGRRTHGACEHLQTKFCILKRQDLGRLFEV